jgi:hypothetical protein
MAPIFKKILIFCSKIIRPAEKIGSYSLFLGACCRLTVILFNPEKMLLEKVSSIGQVAILGGVVLGNFGCQFLFWQKVLLVISLVNNETNETE